MERLTHRKADGTILIERKGKARDSFSNYMLPTDIAAVRRLAYYEDLEEQGQLVVLNEEKALALAAVVHGCNTNRRLVGASYIRNIRSDNSQSISYYRTIEILTEIVEQTLKEGADNVKNN